MKRVLFAVAPTMLLAQNIQVTPSNPTVNVGQAITIQTDRPVQFSLEGVGTITKTSGTSTTYVAPANAQPQSVLDGCMVLPSDSVFNTRIDSLPVAQNSDTWTQATLIGSIAITYGWGTNVVDHTTPTAPYSFNYTQNLNGASFPLLPFFNRKREEGSYTTDFNNDHHMVMLNHENCTFYELYADTSNIAQPKATSGWIYDSASYVQPTDGTTDAASLPLTPLVMHLAEIKAGLINHALRVTACTGCVSPQFVWPAMYSTGAQAGAAPMGTRFRLKSNFDISQFPPAAQVVLRALKQYGMIVADLGTTGQIISSTDITEDGEVTAELNTIYGARIPGSSFEAVDESWLILNSGLSVVNPNNGYVQPANQAVLKMIDEANPGYQTMVPIAIKPVLVGTPDPKIVVQAGTEAFQIPYWVNNASNTGVEWLLGEGAVGSIDSEGRYTAPRRVTAPVTFPITAVSAQDPWSTATLYVTVIPAGTIRIDSGSAVETTDEKGNTWLPDMGLETASYAAINDNYPVGAWGNIPNLVQMQTYIYTWGDDIEYRFHVPNGRYEITYMYGLGDCSGTITPEVSDNGLLLGPVGLETQNTLVYGSWNAGSNGFHCRVPEIKTLPALVTGTTLRFNIRAEGGTNQHSPPSINGLTIARYTGPATLTIDTQQKTQLLVYQSVALSVINWFLPAFQPVWAVERGPGTITAAGVYTAPSSSTGSFAIISATDPGTNLRATTMLWIPPS